MRRLLFTLLVVSIFAASCTHGSRVTTPYMSTGTIMGPSMFANPCSEQWWIRINDTTAGNTFHSLPAGCGIDLSTATFPINVRVNWHNTGTCNIVVIDGIERAD